MHPIWFIKDFSSLGFLSTLEKLSITLVVIFVAFSLIALLARRLTCTTTSEHFSEAAAEESARIAAAVAAARHLHETTP